MEFVSTSPVFLAHRDSISTKYARHSVPAGLRTTIGNDVWIGEGAYIRAGVTVGSGAVIGMGSVVTSDVAPYAIHAGIPARPIRSRFSPEVAEALLSLRWWDWSDERLHAAGSLFNDPEALLRHGETL
jgi:acetyltransferase-like isoleucine patch superfamily enzyme